VRSPGGLKHDVRQLVETLAVKAPGKRQIIIDIDSQKVSIGEMTQRHHFPGNSRGVDLSLYQLELLDGVVACEEWEAKNAGGSAVIDSPMVGPVSVSDSIVDHIIWVDEEKAKHGEIVIKKDDFDIDYFDLVNGSIELDKRSKGSVVQVETHNPQRLQYMRRGGVMTIGDSMLGFCKNLSRSIKELDTKYEQVNGEKTRPFPLERSWFFRIPLTRLFSGSHMDSYIGWRTRGMLSSQRAYYFDYGEAIENAFKDISTAGLNFKVHMPFTQGAVAVDITEKNVDRQAEELAEKLQGKPSVKKNILEIGQAQDLLLPAGKFDARGGPTEPLPRR